MKLNFKNAFSLPPRPEFTHEDELLVRRVAEKIRERRMRQPAFLALESSKPLHFIGSQALTFFRPFVELAAGPGRTEAFLRILENPRAAEMLASLLAAEDDGGPARTPRGEV